MSAPLEFTRMHKAPRKVRIPFGCRLGDLSAKSRWLYRRSLERYLGDPARRELYDRLGKALGSGIMGKVESFRRIIT